MTTRSYEQYALEMIALSTEHVPGVRQLYHEAAWRCICEERALLGLMEYESGHRSTRTKEHERLAKHHTSVRGEMFGLCNALATIASNMGDGFDSVAHGFVHQEVWELVNQADLETRQAETATN